MLKIQKTEGIKQREISQKKAEDMRIGEQVEQVTLRITQTFLL